MDNVDPQAASMEVTRWAAPEIDQQDLSQASTDDSFNTADAASNDSLASAAEGEEGVGPTIFIFKYIDDTTTVEVLDRHKGIRHVSGAHPTEHFVAAATGNIMTSISTRAGEIGMVVNAKKTQLLCVSVNNGYETSASFNFEGSEIRGSDTIKLLGFVLGGKPGAGDQVDMILRKFRARFWMLIHLRRSGVRGGQLYRLYAALVRPVIEVNAVIYHPMLTKGQSEALERLQKLSLRLCYGGHRHYRDVLEEEGIDSLEAWREKCVRKFAQKALNNPRFSQDWFVRRPEVATDIRRRKPFVEKRARTNRYQKSPLIHLQKIANEIYTEMPE